MIYDENYYKSKNYNERKDRYFQLANEIDNLFIILSLKTNLKILDYGCAFGFLTEGLQKLNYFVNGFEISDFCINICKSKSISLDLDLIEKYDLLICLDVFEHMSNTQIEYLLKEKKFKYIIGRIPVSKNNKNEFHLEISKNDKTHINCKSKLKWKEFFNKSGYNIIFHLNLSSIYDSDGVFSFFAIKN